MVRPIQWTDDFVIGHAGIDGEHRRMLELINEAAAAAHRKDASLASALQSLREATAEHLRNENRILRDIREGTYAGLRELPALPSLAKAIESGAFDRHMVEHEGLLEQLDGFSALPPEQLGETLQGWFLDHAIKHDMHLKAIFNAPSTTANR